MDNLRNEVEALRDEARTNRQGMVEVPIELLSAVLKALSEPVEQVEKTKDEWGRFTPRQTRLLFWAYDSIYEKKRNNFFYAETGSCKPWRVHTINALVKRGYITVDEIPKGVFYVRLTVTGVEAAKRIHTNVEVSELA